MKKIKQKIMGQIALIGFDLPTKSLRKTESKGKF